MLRPVSQPTGIPASTPATEVAAARSMLRCLGTYFNPDLREHNGPDSYARGSGLTLQRCRLRCPDANGRAVTDILRHEQSVLEREHIRRGASGPARLGASELGHGARPSADRGCAGDRAARVRRSASRRRPRSSRQGQSRSQLLERAPRKRRIKGPLGRTSMRSSSEAR
jgi:hypothetical protein